MRLKKTLAAAVAAVVMAGGAATASAEGEQFFPMLSYRVGPYAAGGTGVFGGFIDYLNLLNERDGGINGVKLTYEECETEYKNDRGVECYERLKNNGSTGASAVNPVSTGITYALLDRVLQDKIPLVTIGYGRTDASDGRVFPYVFPLVANYWSGNTAVIKYIGGKEGGMENLKGKKIVHIYHDSGYGKEHLASLAAQSEKYGFEVVNIAVTPPGNEQQSQWLQVRRESPDWVVLTGWGVMTPTAIKQAARINFPREKIVGNWWTGAEEDVIPAGDAAIGFTTANLNPAGTDFPAIQQIQDLLYKNGKGNMEDPERVGSVYYNRGIIHGILNTEAVRTAQAKFGNRPLTGEEMRWGFENLNITAERLAELGLAGMMSPIKTSCEDHEGGAPVRFHQWDGKQWNLVTDFIDTDKSIVTPMVLAGSEAYAKEKGITPRDCSKES